MKQNNQEMLAFVTNTIGCMNATVIIVTGIHELI